MGLYSTFSTSQYYDEDTKKNTAKETKPYEQSKKTILQAEQPKVIRERRSLYAEAQIIESSKNSEYGHIKFKDIYRVGQPIAVQKESGEIRTKKGRIIEIVSNDLMYVSMEDSYRDVNGQWLVDFVTPKDKILLL